MKIKVHLIPNESGYTVHAPDLVGCISEGSTKEEALTNIKEAIALWIETEDIELEIYEKNNINSI